jgi:transcriptional repressor OPI1
LIFLCFVRDTIVLSVLANPFIDFHHLASHGSNNNINVIPFRPLTTRDDMISHSPEQSEEDSEPLLNLITSSHPWIGGTINGSLYAYNSTMHYSPAFLQSFIEKNMTTVGNGIGSLSRATGVESRVRQYFGDTPERKNARASHKRHREPSPEKMEDIERGYPITPTHAKHRSRTGSQVSFAETLPEYDENRSPEYEQHPSQLALQQPPQAWSTRIMITTSGLGVALSDKSLSSLKYCLTFLKQATDHLTEIMAALRKLIAECEQNAFGARRGSQPTYTLNAQQEASSQAIADSIKKLGTDIMSTLQVVTDNVSRYTGGRLPENAGALVRRQLMSVPQRWRLAQESTPASSSPNTEGESDALRTGQRFLVFAEQGCDMIAQVSLVLSGTVESAEQWLDSMGRRRESVATSISEKTIGVNPIDMSEKR